MTSETIKVFHNAGELAHFAAGRFLKNAEAAVSARGRFAVALSGGSTPLALYAELAGHFREHREDRDLLKRIHFFFGDERAVPPKHEDSNYRAARDALFYNIKLPKENIHRIRTELPPGEAAAAYEDELKSFFGLAEGQWPVFDLVFLGMGADGHTASLFPDTPALGEVRAWVVANRVEKLNAHRITLTAPVFNHAREVIFMICGLDKAETLNLVLHGPSQPETWPAQLIAPENGELLWLLDREAASGLMV